MKRALISVSDKTGIIDFAKKLESFDYEIISTGGTLKFLREHNISAKSVSSLTNFPEILDGRVKTLHPNIHGGILSLRDNDSHLQQLREHQIDFIDMVVVNLYPFEQVINNDGSFEDAIENIDIGGPAMLRSAAKNFNDVTVVCDYNDYAKIIMSLEKNVEFSSEFNLKLSAKAYAHTAKYDSIIANYLHEYLEEESEYLTLSYDLISKLRYGENPHQSAYFYKGKDVSYSVTSAKKMHGKQLSYNNILDANAALNLIKEFDNPTCVAIKHLNPCGVGESDTIFSAYKKAYESDPVSIFGGIVAFNDQVDESIAIELSKIFLEIIIAPSFTVSALDILVKKKNVRILEVNMNNKQFSEKAIVGINGGLLIQDIDNSTLENFECVSKSCEFNIADVKFAWKVCKHVKSNGIVVVSNQMTVGVGVGQTSRIGSCEIALESAKLKGYNNDLILASDAFFPFADAVELAAKYGVKTIISSGGSVNDEEVIAKCDALGITMLFTGIRNFKH
ncbi:MAG: bifunctional phosphoribosylaminoimidazolecarboxamide formyltransferase/IMP cyclohydrolase [Bacilli bacterium]